MNTERWKRVERLFIAAAKLPAEQREAFVERECSDDAELLREVVSLLRSDEQGEGSLTSLVRDGAERAAQAVDAGRVDQRIGAYRVVRELDRGGMGIVFLAQRADDAYSKSVAIKLLRFGLGREDLVRRFKSERQILATLDHPNIARLLDGGTTDSGEPYVVMEYIEGRSIEEHCDAERLTTEERLELFLEVCSALQYAHERSVIHRDIKPGNILITADGMPKLLDFGIAKLLDTDSIEGSVVQTGTSTRLMTPEYASPEQIRGEPVTPATDVYALGLLLYELLAGRHPYRSDATHPGELARLICEHDPRRPSTAVTSVATAQGDSTAETVGAARRTQPARLRRRLAGDLDTIVMTALRKEPSRRYASVRSLADDVRRHLEGEPIRARPTTVFYRVAKFVRRKPIHAVLLLTLIVGVPTVGVLGAQAVRQNRVEQRERIDSLLSEARWLEERQLFEEVRTRTDEILELKPEHGLALRHRAWARHQLANVTSDENEAAELRRGALDDAEQTIRAVPGESWPHVLHSFLLREMGQTEEAARAQLRAQELVADSAEELYFAARLATDSGEHERAVELFSELILRHPDRTSAMISLAYAYEKLGDLDSAVTEYRVASGISPEQDLIYIDLGRVAMLRGDYDGATRYLERALELDESNAISYENLGYLLWQRGGSATEPEQAVALFDQAESALRRSLELNPNLLWAEVSLGSTLIQRARLAETSDPSVLPQALEHYANVLARWPTPPEAGHQRSAYSTALASSCDVLIHLDRLDDALTTCREVTTEFPDNAIGFYNLAGVHALRGDTEQALVALRRDHELGDNDWRYLLEDAWFEGLREHPRFVDLLRRMKIAAGD
ncbi:MAG: protein kinase [bacterium]|nr:protein kinase [bacterium]